MQSIGQVECKRMVKSNAISWSSNAQFRTPSHRCKETEENMPKEDNDMVEYIQSIVDRERSQLKKHSAQIEAFTAYALTQGIVLEAHHFSYFYTIGVIVSSPGITERFLENETRERDRLFSFNSLSRRY